MPPPAARIASSSTRNAKSSCSNEMMTGGKKRITEPSRPPFSTIKPRSSAAR
ncbi:Uncharacterised protein [Vibrio cholerae]|nr:Uncharacterised protein [Vibrio cholerae]